MKFNHAPVNIPQPCPKKWADLVGDSKERFCQHCCKSVHNLSHMSSSERALLLSNASQVCVAYESDPKGRFITHSTSKVLGFIPRIRITIVAIVASIAPFAFSSCTTVGKLGPLPQSENKQIKEVESKGKTFTTLGEIIIAERPLWQRILWPFK